MLLRLFVGSLVLLTSVTSAPRLQQGAGPVSIATVTTQIFQSSALVTGASPGRHGTATGTSLVMGGSLQTDATSALAPFDSTAGADVSLGAGPSAPVRFALTAEAMNAGLGAPPFTPVYREGLVRVDVVLTLVCERGARWNVDAQALLQATWGAGFGCVQVQIDVGDDGVTEATWSCMTPTHQLTVVGTAPDDRGLRIRVRTSGAARSWTTSTPDHFAAQVILDCTPATVVDYGAREDQEGGDYGMFDLERPVPRRGEAAGRRPSLASREDREDESLSAVRA